MADSGQRFSLFDKIRSRKTFYPLLAFGVVLILLVLMTRISGRPPEIKSISPEISRPGEFMVIEGDAFGEDKAQVFVAGLPLTARMIKEWTDRKITLVLPENASSGWVYIKTATGRSNSLLFTNIDQIPRPVGGEDSSANNSYIQSLSPASGPVGTLVIIKGRNFGSEQAGSSVLFSRNVSAGNFNASSSQSGFIACQERDFDYEYWSDKEIRIRVPDGATSGMLKIINQSGQSNTYYFDVNSQSGVGYLAGRRIYQLSYGLTLDALSTRGGGFIDFYLPLISEDARTSNIVIKSNSTPWASYRDYNIYRMTEFSTDLKVSLTIDFEGYTYKTKVFSESETNEPLKGTKLYEKYTFSEALVTPDYGFASEILYNVKLTGMPYIDARAIYNYLISRMRYSPYTTDMDIAGQYTRNETGSLGYAVMLASTYRRAGIPARVVSGLLVTDILNYTNRPHAWVEFYYNKMGWIPVDPALGATPSLTLHGENTPVSEYYFGNLDAFHIAFAHGILTDGSKASLVYEAPMYSQILMNNYIVPSSEVISWVGSWRPIKIVGIY